MIKYAEEGAAPMLVACVNPDCQADIGITVVSLNELGR